MHLRFEWGLGGGKKHRLYIQFVEEKGCLKTSESQQVGFFVDKLDTFETWFPTSQIFIWG